MRRRLALLLLLIIAFWQTLAIGGHAQALGGVEQAAHAVLHWQEEPHHHHDDGSVSQDNSVESVQHVVADGYLSGAAVMSAGMSLFLPRAMDRPFAGNEPAPPWPHLDGLRRPPRPTT
ncbi:MULTISPECIES: hypothetical protein [unclassified Variovorax]|uniref:hypothetical protein n=1 Tax=unclassified Variovorax TaxID=663243 RepID=UPI000837B906|nr:MULTISPECIES: hypothetical protein [unclassified Variovorax]